MTKQRRVRARVIQLGPTFQPAADKLGPGASDEALAVASTLIDRFHPEPNRRVRIGTVMDKTGYSRPHIIRMADDPRHDFPASTQEQKGYARTWDLYEVLQWNRGRTKT